MSYDFNQYSIEQLKTAHENVGAARELLSDYNKWTTGSMAITIKSNGADGTYAEGVDPFDPDACAFCAVGALRFVSGMDARIGEGYGWMRDDTPMPQSLIERQKATKIRLSDFKTIGAWRESVYHPYMASVCALADAIYSTGRVVRWDGTIVSSDQRVKDCTGVVTTTNDNEIFKVGDPGGACYFEEDGKSPERHALILTTLDLAHSRLQALIVEREAKSAVA